MIIEISCDVVLSLAILEVIINNPFFFIINLKKVTSISLKNIRKTIHGSTTSTKISKYKNPKKAESVNALSARGSMNKPNFDTASYCLANIPSKKSVIDAIENIIRDKK